VRRGTCQQREIQQAGIGEDRLDVVRRMVRWRDGHVLGEAKLQVVALAGLLIRHARVKFDDDPAKPGMIARPRVERRGSVGRCRGRPQRQHHQNDQGPELRDQLPKLRNQLPTPWNHMPEP
jgi:hypothetical protein